MLFILCGLLGWGMFGWVRNGGGVSDESARGCGGAELCGYGGVGCVLVECGVEIDYGRELPRSEFLDIIFQFV